MINFPGLLFLSVLGDHCKTPPESCTKFSSSLRPSGANTGGPQGPELTSAWLMDGLRLRLKSSKPTLFPSHFALLPSFVHMPLNPKPPHSAQ